MQVKNKQLGMIAHSQKKMIWLPEVCGPAGPLSHGQCRTGRLSRRPKSDELTVKNAQVGSKATHSMQTFLRIPIDVDYSHPFNDLLGRVQHPEASR